MRGETDRGAGRREGGSTRAISKLQRVGAPAVYCVNCGASLEAGHRYCPLCGAARWTPSVGIPAPGSRGESQRPPPGPGTPAFRPAPVPEEAAPRLRLLPYLFAIGAIFWLFQLAQFAAVVAAPNGRDQIAQSLAHAGYTGDPTVNVLVPKDYQKLGGPWVNGKDPAGE